MYGEKWKWEGKILEGILKRNEIAENDFTLQLL